MSIIKIVSAKGRVYEYIYPRRGRKKTEHHSDFRYKDYGTFIRPAVIELCLSRDGYKCVTCGNLDNLELHHRDLKGFSKSKISNNRIENLLTLCNRCHQLLHLNEQPNMEMIRNDEIYNLHRAGLTFTEIAVQFHITRQRAHQVFQVMRRYQEVKDYRP